jgi:hypothetical protein
LDFHVAPGVGQYIDLAKCMSAVNRRMYRQGMVYSVDFIEYIGNQNDIIAIGKIPEGYSTHRAYTYIYNLWLKQRSEALDELEPLEPGKWSDFKLRMERGHLDAGTDLLPAGLSDGTVVLNSQVAYGNAEWNHADIIYHDIALPGTSNLLNLIMMGSDDLPAGVGSVMNAWADARIRTQNPDPLIPDQAQTSWAAQTGENSADQMEQIVGLIEDENDSPPYANQPDTTLEPIIVGFNSMPGGVLLDTATTGANGRAIALDGGLIPLGLLKFDLAGDVIGGTLRIHMTRGSYHGIAALPMGDFS